VRVSKRYFARRSKTALGYREQAEISLKIEDLKSNKTTDDQQSEFRSVSEFDIINFLNKLKIVENRKKNETIKIKRLWLRLWSPSEINRPLLGSPGPDRCTG
jgi:hypothetical protein